MEEFLHGKKLSSVQRGVLILGFSGMVSEKFKIFDIM